jgi:hypothetical protein
MTMSVTGRLTSVEIYTTSHRVLGRIKPGSVGLYSFLNVPTTSYVEVESAHLSRLHQPGKLAGRFSVLWLVKSEIVAVLLSSRVELGPSGMTRGGYSTAVPHNVHIALGGYELRGMVETAGKFNFGAMMFEGDRIFVPLYSAEITAILFPNVRAESAAMLFNRNMVDTMALLPREEAPPAAPPSPPPAA